MEKTPHSALPTRLTRFVASLPLPKAYVSHEPLSGLEVNFIRGMQNLSDQEKRVLMASTMTRLLYEREMHQMESYEAQARRLSHKTKQALDTRRHEVGLFASLRMERNRERLEGFGSPAAKHLFNEVSRVSDNLPPIRVVPQHSSRNRPASFV